MVIAQIPVTTQIKSNHTQNNCKPHKAVRFNLVEENFHEQPPSIIPPMPTRAPPSVLEDKTGSHCQRCQIKMSYVEGKQRTCTQCRRQEAEGKMLDDDWLDMGSIQRCVSELKDIPGATPQVCGCSRCRLRIKWI